MSLVNDQFLYFCVNIGNEKLLKEEVRIFYPELNFSYSRKGFLTFKNTGVKYDLSSIAELQVAFSTRVGICLGKSKPEEFKSFADNKLSELNITSDNYAIHSYSINTDYSYDAEIVFETSVNKYSAEGKLVLNIISLGKNEVWLGLHRVAKGVTRYPNSQVKINIASYLISIFINLMSI